MFWELYIYIYIKSTHSDTKIVDITVLVLHGVGCAATQQGRDNAHEQISPTHYENFRKKSVDQA